MKALWQLMQSPHPDYRDRTRVVEPDITVFAISGRLNPGNLLQPCFSPWERALRGLIDGGVRKLVIDLTELSAIDSSGIGMLISCAGQMDQLGGQMRLAGVIVHMDRIIPLDPEIPAACTSFSSGATTA